MAERTVSTLLKIDGENEYKAAIQNINREQQTLKANIRLVDEQFRGQANTMAALTERSRLLNSQQALLSQRLSLAKDMYTRATEAVSRYAAQIDAIKAKIAAEGDAEGKLAKQLNAAQEGLQKAQNSTEYYKGAVAKAETEVAKINNQIKDNSKYLDEAKKSATGTATSIDEYGKKTAQATQNSKELGTTGKEAFDSLAQALISAGLIRGVGELVDLFKQAAAASIEWESAFAGVKKTVEGSPEQLAQISDEIKRMSTEIPLTTTELARIAEVAGQLGIKTEDVSKFTEVMSALAVSTNLTAEQAATQLARFAKITGMTADEYDNIGSVIVALGNNSAATESEIVDMAMGIAAAGKLVGMSTPDIMAFAASLTSAGLESQAGGTAISRTLAEISAAANGNIKDLEKYAEVAGMTAEQFASLFKDDATAAFSAFIEGLSTSGDKAIAVLNDMGITEIRQRDALLRLSASHEDLASSIALSSNAYAENSALTEEANKRYETTESKIQLLKNAVNLLGITIGDQMNPAVRNGTQTLTDMTLAVNDFLKENPAAVSAITAFATVISVLALAVAGYTIATKIAIPAIVAFNTALAANPIGLVVLALAALTAGMTAAALSIDYGTGKYEEQIQKNRELRSEIESTANAYEDQIGHIEAEGEAVSGLIDQLDSLMAAQGGNKDNTAQIKNVVDQLNSAVTDLNLTYDETTGKLSMTTAAMRDMTDAMFQQKLQAAMVERQVAAYIELQDAQNALKDTQEALTEAQAEFSAESISTIDAYGNELLLTSPKAAALAGEILKLTKEEKAQQGAVDELQSGYDELSASISGANGEASGLNDTTSDANDIYATAVEKVQELTDKYDAIKTKVADAAEKVGQFGEKLDATGKKNIDYYIKGEQSQSDFWDSYSENLKKAQEMGLDEGLLGKLAEPTEANAQILDSIVSGSLEKVQELNDAFKANADARQQYVDQAAQAQAEAAGLTKQFMDDMNAFMAAMDQGDGAYISGVSTMDGLLTGLEEKLPDLYAFINGVLAELAKLSGLTVDVPGSGTGSGGFNKWKPFRVPMRTGADYIPYDDFPASLHEGESVLTKEEARMWRALKAAAKGATPSASDMVAISRPITARDVGYEVSKAVGSSGGGNTYQSSLTINAPEMPDAYEIARRQRQQLRRMK